eukprot:CAMPEP_0198225976 /NCGR_PEP_ID=MMETSP1445-20131203/103330_1 /TAXON_ID=36898 /ORGANISM="Pyramimonas sp., Strain CCMP2087" /LENGTH=167 /DNA_ID=CAMNT_0043905679 /DNA_START=93 /DNA_END=596 /DNA_ORIENTATION=-
MAESGAPASPEDDAEIPKFPRHFPSELGMFSQLPSKFGDESDSRADTQGKMAAYLAKSKVLSLLEDLTAFLVQHKPNNPWQFLSEHYEKIIPQLKEGIGAQTILREMEVSWRADMEGILENPEAYAKWLNDNGVYSSYQDLIEELATNKPEDSYQAILEFIQKQAAR